MKNLNSFSVYDSFPLEGFAEDLFFEYKKYKEEARKATSSDSIEYRFNFLLKEFKRLHPFITKDKKRLHNSEQKRTLYFIQKGICTVCKKELKYKDASSHHIIPHSKGGSTDDLSNADLLHEICHKKIERSKKNTA